MRHAHIAKHSSIEQKRTAIGPQHRNRDVAVVPASPARRFFGGVREFVVIVVVALLLSSLIRAFLIQVFWIPSTSMMPTLHVNDRIAVSRIASFNHKIERGDVVVFNDDLGWIKSETTSGAPALLRDIGEFLGILPANGETTLVKRVIGVAGDHVQCRSLSGDLEVNGQPISEPFVNGGTQACAQVFDVTVPAGHLWVMGDNRTNSADSAYHFTQGEEPFVSVDAVVGRAKAIIWPVNRWTSLDGRQYFANVADNTQ